MIRLSGLQGYLVVLALGAAGVACGLLAYTVGYDGKINLLGLNYRYTAVGWVFRVAAFLIGVSTVALSWRGNPIIPARRHHGLGFVLGTIGIFWEFASIALLIGFVIMAIVGN